MAQSLKIEPDPLKRKSREFAFGATKTWKSHPLNWYKSMRIYKRGADVPVRLGDSSYGRTTFTLDVVVIEATDRSTIVCPLVAFQNAMKVAR